MWSRSNVTEDRIVSISKLLQSLITTCCGVLGISPVSLHHTTRSSEKLIIDELTQKSHVHVFDYTPGRKYRSFPNI